MQVLVLEASTSSAKAIVYDPDRGVVSSAAQRLSAAILQNGICDTEGVFQLTMETGRRAASGFDIDAIVVCGVWHSVAVCDSALRPDAGTFLWNYSEPAQMCRDVRSDAALSDELYRRTGCMPHAIYPRHALRYLKEQGLDLRGRLLPTQAGYHFYRLTDEFIETCNIMSGSGLLNLRSREYDDMALDYAGIRADQLGTLGGYTDIRPLSERGALQLGLSRGIPVVPAHSDGALNQIACDGAVSVSVGTSGAVRVDTREPFLPEDGALWCYCGAWDYICGAAVSSAGNAVEWFRDRFLGGRVDLNTLDAESCACDKLPVCLPFVFGERNPGWRDDRRAVFAEVTSQHTLADMYRSLQAGILFNLYQCYRSMGDRLTEARRIILSGGILNSRCWTQMAADVFGRTILCMHDRDASLIGGAALALQAVGETDAVRRVSSCESLEAFAPSHDGPAQFAPLYEKYLSYYASGFL